MKKISTILSLVLIVSCSVNKMLTPSQADADRGSQKFSGLTLNELKEGKALYKDNCGMCHMLFEPNSRGEEGWNDIVPPMVDKVNKKAGHEELDKKMQDKILKYLVVMSAKKAS